MATQLQGPRRDPHVLYKHFWQEPPEPMHKDDLILQACHYQPSDTQPGPSFPPCEYFPSPWKKRARQSGSAALLFNIHSTRSLKLKPLPALKSPSSVTMSHLHGTGVVPAETLDSSLVPGGLRAASGLAPLRG